MKRYTLLPLLFCLLLNTAAAATAVSVTATPRQANHTTPSAERLRAHAVLLSEQTQSYAEHEQAFYAWQAIIRHSPNDADALFNAAYQAQKAYKQGNRLQQSAWLPHIKQGYWQVLVLNPDNYYAMNNWGVALDDEAWALGQNNPFNEEAWDKWKKAHRQYSKALREDFSQPLNNWISSLI